MTMQNVYHTALWYILWSQVFSDKRFSQVSSVIPCFTYLSYFDTTPLFLSCLWEREGWQVLARLAFLRPCFILRARRLSSKLLKEGYLGERLKSSFRKFYGRYGDLIEQYGVTLSRMLNDILTLDQQWLPYQSDFPPISWPLYRAWPSPNYEWFPWSICNGCG